VMEFTLRGSGAHLAIPSRDRPPAVRAGREGRACGRRPTAARSPGVRPAFTPGSGRFRRGARCAEPSGGGRAPRACQGCATPSTAAGWATQSGAWMRRSWRQIRAPDDPGGCVASASASVPAPAEPATAVRPVGRAPASRRVTDLPGIDRRGTRRRAPRTGARVPARRVAPGGARGAFGASRWP
jgi:hypothetical protein